MAQVAGDPGVKQGVIWVHPILSFKENIMHFELKIEPAIPVIIRQKLERVLLSEGYNVIGGGTDEDQSACDISFETVEPGNTGKE
jgi:hypothetical protein